LSLCRAGGYLAVGGGMKDSVATVDICVWLSRSSQATFVPEQRLFPGNVCSVAQSVISGFRCRVVAMQAFAHALRNAVLRM
jgi:hypothetical protein